MYQKCFEFFFFCSSHHLCVGFLLASSHFIETFFSMCARLQTICFFFFFSSCLLGPIFKEAATQAFCFEEM